MSRQPGFERVGGSAEGGLEFIAAPNPYPGQIAEHLRKSAPTSDGAAGADWVSWRPSPEAHAAGQADLLRVGRARGLDGGPDPVVCMGGLGKFHTSLRPGASSQELARQLALRMAGSARNVNILICDLARTGAFTDFVASEQSTNVFPDDVDKTIADLARQQHRVATEPNVRVGSVRDPWNILLLTGNPRSQQAQEHLARLAQSTEWGSIVAVGSEIPDSDILQVDVPPIPGFYPDPPVPRHMIASALSSVAESSRLKVPTMRELILAQSERMPSAQGLEARVGVDGDGQIVSVCFGDEAVHGLVVGKTGSGKTNEIGFILADLLHTYGPDDMRLIVVDGKKADMTMLVPDDTNEKDNANFPQLHLAGLNIVDPEDGVAVLEYLENEMERRALLIGDKRAKNIAGLREKVPGETWPRILVVWDEVQVLLNGPEKERAMGFIIRLATEGRGSGIHLLFGTQDWRNVDALWKAPAILDQFALRLALEGGGRVMDQENQKVMQRVPKHGVAINARSGVRYEDADNQVAKAPAVTIEDMTELRVWAARQRGWKSQQPTIVLDGRVSPVLESSRAYTELRPVADKPAVGLIGQAAGYQDRPRAFEFRSAPGRNFAVLGSNEDEARQVMSSVVRSVAKQHDIDRATFSVVYHGSAYSKAANELVAELKRGGHKADIYQGGAAQEFLAATSDAVGQVETDDKHYVVVYGGDGVNSKYFKPLIEKGSQNGTHVIGWWPSLQLLKSSLGGFIASTAGFFDGLALLNVSQAELNSVTDQKSHRTWGHFNRRDRALFFDATGDTGQLGQMVKTYK